MKQKLLFQEELDGKNTYDYSYVNKHFAHFKRFLKDEQIKHFKQAQMLAYIKEQRFERQFFK